MKRLLLALFWLLPLSLFGAAGDVVSVVVDTNGWTALVTFESMTNKGTYRFGLATNNTTEAAKMLLSLTSQGFDDAGGLTTLARTIYGTYQVRGVYPGEATNQENVVNTTNIQCRIALSDFVFAGDSNLTCTMLSGCYSNFGLASAAASSLSVANYSTNIYPKPIANWSRPPHELVSASPATVACVAFGLGAQSGRPVRAVKFWAVDEATTASATNIITAASIDRGYGDQVPVVEYIGSINLAGLANSNVLTVHFEVLPWLGTNSLNTADGRYTFPDYEATSTRLFYCTNFPVLVACVANDGVDSTGQVTNQVWFDTNAPPASFRTIGGAARAIADTNFALYGAGRHDNSGAIIYLQAGGYTNSHITKAPFTTNIASTWTTLTPFPGVARSSVTISNSSNSTDFSEKIKVLNCTLGSKKNPGAIYDVTDYVWFDQCDFTTLTADTRMINTVTNIYVTRSLIPANGSQGLYWTSSGGTTNFRLIRGNNFDNFVYAIHPCTVLGNSRLAGTNGVMQIRWPISAGSATCPYPIIAFNRITCQLATVHNVTIVDQSSVAGAGFKITNGCAFVQNVFEQVAPAVANRLLSIAPSEQTIPDTNQAPNFLMWNNTGVGNRVNFLENAGTQAVDAVRVYASLVNNSFDNINSKDDLDYSDAPRVGNWPVMFGVGSSGNTDLDVTWMDGSWDWSFGGINSYIHGIPGWNGTTNGSGWAIYAAYIDRKSGYGDGTTNSGNGNYRIHSRSPMLRIPTRWVLPYDIEGNARGLLDPPGAYASASPRKGGGFFAP